MTLKIDAKCEEKLICCFQNDKTLVKVDLSTQKSQKLARVIFHNTEEWCKIWRKTGLWFGKWWEYGKFSPEHLKVSKLQLWWDPLIQSRKCMCLKFMEESCVMTMKNDTKFEEELTCCFQIDMRNLTNFDPTLESLKHFHFNVLLLSKVYIVWAKKIQSNYLLWHWRGIQSLKKKTDLWKWHEEFGRFSFTRAGKNHGKFEEEMRNFTNLTWALQNL